MLQCSLTKDENIFKYIKIINYLNLHTPRPMVYSLYEGCGQILKSDCEAWFNIFL